MEVKVLGTGSIYSKSNSSSILIDRHILVDVGPGVVKYLIKEDCDLLEIDNIILTHLHADHIMDFPTFIVNVDELGLNKKINVYSPNGTKEKILNLMKVLYGNWFDEFIDNYFNFVDIDDGVIFKIMDYEIKTVEVNHPGIASYGFIFNNGFGISGDSSMCEGVKEIVDSSNVVFIDCSFIEGNDYHMGIDDIEKLNKEYIDKSFVLTHFRDKTRELLKENDNENVLIIDDGYSFEIGE